MVIQLIWGPSTRLASRNTKNGQCSRADAGNIRPSASPALAAMTGNPSHQQAAAICRSERARPVSATADRRPMHARTSVLSALPQPRHAASAAADLAAAHRALCSLVLSIEGVRTYARAINTKVVPVFRAFQRAHPAGSRSSPSTPLSLSGSANDYFRRLSLQQTSKLKIYLIWWYL